MRGKVRDRILRVLTNNPLGDMSKYEIARKAGATYPWVREFLLKLEELGVIKGTKVSAIPVIAKTVCR